MKTENTLSSSAPKLVVLQNILFQDEFTRLANTCAKNNIAVIAIKGISFFGRIYNHAERSMTDIDILIDICDLPFIRQTLTNDGYSERLENKWQFDHYKTIFSKYLMGLEVVFEVHTQLLSDKAKDIWTTVPYQNFQILSPTDELVYLAYHYAYQHTLLHPKWLHDIYLLSRKHTDCWSGAWELAKSKEIHSALIATAQALNRKYDMGIFIPHSLKKLFFLKLIHVDFINHSEKFPIKYYVAKHFIKDHFMTAISYDLKWIYFNLKKRFLK